MLWCDFRAKLKELNPRIWINVNAVSDHPEYPSIKLCGIHFGNKHICSVSYQDSVPWEDVIDKKGVLLHQGLKTILSNLLSSEFVPHYFTEKAYYFNARITRRDVERVFRVDAALIRSNN